jgi:hypothetical protein
LGLGDHIISTSIVRRAFEKVKKPVCIGDGSVAEWSPVFENNPKIAREPYPGVSWVRTYKGARPYIERVEEERLVYKKHFRVEPGEIFLTDSEKHIFDGYENAILIEPNTKRLPLSKNKDWGIGKWQAVVDALPEFKFVQLKTGKYKLQGVEHIGSPGIRHGFSMVYKTRLFVGTDGALHHAAAALNKRAVVIWGGLASPENLGYGFHKNLWAGSKPCGSKTPCFHCQMELEKITVEMVVKAIKDECGKRELGERATVAQAA